MTPSLLCDETVMIGNLNDVRNHIAQLVRKTSLGALVDEFPTVFGSGKMLRSRLAFRMGAANGLPHERLVHVAAAIEMTHAASLLHDDVIDGGLTRRGKPSFWTQKGKTGSILLGDLMVCLASRSVLEEDNRLVPIFLECLEEMCNAEAEQELQLPGITPDWQGCVDLARRKTGSLFAFVAYACGGNDDVLCRTLREAGYAVGTAYQLADDLFDAFGDQAQSDKTLGTDEATSKLTAASAWWADGTGPIGHLNQLCESSLASLAPWPDLHRAWRTYMTGDLFPQISKFLNASRLEGRSLFLFDGGFPVAEEAGERSCRVEAMA